MSTSDPRTLTEFDVRRLDALAQRVRGQVKPPGTPTPLERELARAVQVKPEDIPPTIVTMNSEVEVIDLATDECRSITVVFPAMASVEAGRVSVLAPLGTALIGRREGARVALHTPRGPRQLQVERVLFQPEAAGQFDL